MIWLHRSPEIKSIETYVFDMGYHFDVMDLYFSYSVSTPTESNSSFLNQECNVKDTVCGINDTSKIYNVRLLGQTYLYSFYIALLQNDKPRNAGYTIHNLSTR